MEKLTNYMSYSKNRLGLMLYLDIDRDDFSIINIGVHECEKDYAFFLVVFGLGARIQWKKLFK